MPGLEFPKDMRQSKDAFIMYPLRYSVDREGARTVEKTIPETVNAIVLPTPSNGLLLNESGNWDEAAAFQFSPSSSDAGAALKAVGIKTAIEQGGPLAQLATKGSFRNDYASLSYSGSNFRTYTFEWDMIPASLDEAESIANIIKTIRQAALPSYDGALIKFPRMWRIIPTGAKIDMYLKDCVITNFTVNFTPDGVLRRFNSGHPVSINMSIDFKELSRATREDAS